MKNTNDSKQCNKCEEVKPQEGFRKHARQKDGLSTQCRACESIYKKSRKGTFELKTSKAIYKARSKAKELGVENTLTLAEVRAILSNERCAYCHAETEEKKRTLDHVQPLDDNGANTFENVVMACSTCNTAKHNRPVYDFIMKKAHSEATNGLLDVLAERMELSRYEALRCLETQQSTYNEKQFRAKHYGVDTQ